MIERFPQMIYHPALDPITVYNDAELQAHLSQGWSMVPIDQTETGMLEAKINWHLAEAERLQGILNSLNPQEPERQKRKYTKRA